MKDLKRKKRKHNKNQTGKKARKSALLWFIVLMCATAAAYMIFANNKTVAPEAPKTIQPDVTVNVCTAEPSPVATETPEPLMPVAPGSIVINEIMAKNASYLTDENGDNRDWVELFNKSSHSIDLKKCCLSNDRSNPGKWTFPDVTLNPGEYLLVYCSGKTAEGFWDASFKLSGESGCVIFTDSYGTVIDCTEYESLEWDQSLSRLADGFSKYMPPTPGMPNTYESAEKISRELSERNTTGVFINEVMASTDTASGQGKSYDWIEISNFGDDVVELSGWGLSDNPSKPLKWMFPEGTFIEPGQYLGVYLSGLENGDEKTLHAGFSLSATEGETIVLSDSRGQLLDRCPLGRQYCNISYGRTADHSGFRYLSGATPGSANVKTGSLYRLDETDFSVPGGIFESGTVITLSLKGEEGSEIYYTLDCSEPDAGNLNGSKFKADPDVTVKTATRTYKYTKPITIDRTTVVRAVTVKDGLISSIVNTQTYLIGVSHTMNTVSLVLNPSDLWGYTTGIYVKGPNASKNKPYTGANFWKSWEKDANLELYGTDGTAILSQGCGVKLHGQYSRGENQKAFKLIARSKYGDNRFRAALFPNREYTEYHSFLLRSSGQDWNKSHMRDSLLSSLAAGLDVMYQDTALCVVYLNGEYWGLYNMRECINTYSICQWENWDTDLRDDMDLLKGNTVVMQGSSGSWTELKTWYKKNGIDTAEKLAYVEQYIDVKNYLNYCAVEIYTGNTDLLNCKKYRLASDDGKWRHVLFDFDWAFYTDTNSVRRWLTAGGVGEQNKYDNSLFIALMKNSECRDYFLSLFSEKLATTWSSESVLSMIQERYDLLEPEMNAHLLKWEVARGTYKTGVNKLKKYASTRPGRLLYFFKNALGKTEFEKYFGEIAKSVKLIDDKGNSSSYYK